MPSSWYHRHIDDEVEGVCSSAMSQKPSGPYCDESDADKEADRRNVNREGLKGAVHGLVIFLISYGDTET